MFLYFIKIYFSFAASRLAPTRKHKQLTIASESDTALVAFVLDSRLTTPDSQFLVCHTPCAAVASSSASAATAAAAATSPLLALTNRLAADKRLTPSCSWNAVGLTADVDADADVTAIFYPSNERGFLGFPHAAAASKTSPFEWSPIEQELQMLSEFFVSC